MDQTPTLAGDQETRLEPDDSTDTDRRFTRLLAQLQDSRDHGDGRLILLTEEAAGLATLPGQIERIEALLELAQSDPWQTCLTVGCLARRTARLDEEDLHALVDRCNEALEIVPQEDREGLLEDLAHEGQYRFLRVELELALERCPAAEVASKFAAGLRRLPPSARALLDLDSLVRLSMDRMGPEPLGSWLDHLLQTIPLRDLRDDALSEAVAAAYARALDYGDVQARHRDRLLYLSRFAQDPANRARLLIRHDLARLASVPRDIGDPELVLEPLVHFPGVLSALPEREAQAMIAFLLRRLVRRLTDVDHLRIGRVLCDPANPGPFFAAYHHHIKALTVRASPEVQLELWREFFAAWLSHRAGDLGEVMRPLLRSVIRGIEREPRTRLNKILKRRFGIELQTLLQEAKDTDDQSGWRWRWPWSSRPFA